MLNPSEFKFQLPNVFFVGHRLTAEGLQVDSTKVEAIKTFLYLDNVSAVCRFISSLSLSSFQISHQ